MFVALKSSRAIFFQEHQIIFNVTGVFYENKTPSGTDAPLRKVLRCFARSMILIAPGTQILQDNLIVSNPTESLIQVTTRFLLCSVPSPG